MLGLQLDQKGDRSMNMARVEKRDAKILTIFAIMCIIGGLVILWVS